MLEAIWTKRVAGSSKTVACSRLAVIKSSVVHSGSFFEKAERNAYVYPISSFIILMVLMGFVCFKVLWALVRFHNPPAPACQGHQGWVFRFSSLFNN